MYLIKAKKNIEEQDARILQEKRERYNERLSGSPSERSDESTTDNLTSFHPDELPDGACISPQKIVENGESDYNAVKSAEVGFLLKLLSYETFLDLTFEKLFLSSYFE